MTAAHAITPEQLEAMLERAAEAPVVIDDKTQAAANDIAAKGKRDIDAKGDAL